MKRTYKLISIAAILMMAPGLVGCLGTFDGEGNLNDYRHNNENLLGDFDNASIFGNVDVRNATLVGAIAHIDGLHHYATGVEAYGGSDYVSINVTVDNGDDGAAMAIVDVFGLDMIGTEGGAVGIQVIGCSGPEPGNWEFDQTADDVDFDVHQNADGTVTLAYTATITPYSYSYGWEGEDEVMFDDYYEPEYEEGEATVISGVITFAIPDGNDETWGPREPMPIEAPPAQGDSATGSTSN
jgi:hypothetical protein